MLTREKIIGVLEKIIGPAICIFALIFYLFKVPVLKIILFLTVMTLFISGIVLVVEIFMGSKLSKQEVFKELQKKLDLSDDEREHIERMNRCSDNVEIENSGDVQILRSQRVKVINSPNVKIEDSDDVEIKDSEKAEVKKSPGARIEKSIEAKAENSPGAEIVKSQGAKATDSAGIKINNSHGAIVDQTREQTTNQNRPDTESPNTRLAAPQNVTPPSPREEKFGNRTYRHYKVSKDFLLKVYEQNDGRLEFVDRYQLKWSALWNKATVIVGAGAVIISTSWNIWTTVCNIWTTVSANIHLKNGIIDITKTIENTISNINITWEAIKPLCGIFILVVLTFVMSLLVWKVRNDGFYDKIIKEILEENSEGRNAE